MIWWTQKYSPKTNSYTKKKNLLRLQFLHVGSSVSSNLIIMLGDQFRVCCENIGCEADGQYTDIHTHSSFQILRPEPTAETRNTPMK